MNKNGQNDIFFNARNYWNDVSTYLCMHRPTMVLISTYNLWTAISNWSGTGKLPYRMNPNQKVMTYLNNESVDGRIIIGVKSEPMLRELDIIKRTWPNVAIKYIENHHAKCTIAVGGETKMWVGSANFNDSFMNDLILTAPDVMSSKVIHKFEKWWGEGEFL